MWGCVCRRSQCWLVRRDRFAAARIEPRLSGGHSGTWFGSDDPITLEHRERPLVHTLATTPANVNNLNMAGALLHGDEEAAFGDAGYRGVHKRPDAAGPTWHLAMQPGKRRKLNPFIEPEFVAERIEKMKASIRAKVEHPFRVIMALAPHNPTRPMRSLTPARRRGPVVVDDA